MRLTTGISAAAARRQALRPIPPEYTTGRSAWHKPARAAVSCKCWLCRPLGIRRSSAPAEPCDKRVSIKGASGHPQDDLLGSLNGAEQLVPVQDQKRLHRGMTHPFVAINEGVVLDQGETEGCGLGHQVRIQILAGEGHAGLSHGRFQGTEVPKAFSASTLVQEAVMQDKYLAQGEVAHLGEASIELAILLEDSLRRPLKFLGRCHHEVADGRSGKIRHWDMQPLGGLPQTALGVVR